MIAGRDRLLAERRYDVMLTDVMLGDGDGIETLAAVQAAARLPPAEAMRPEYGFLPTAHRERARIAKPGTMFVSQPQLPVPLVVEFPFPAWATRPDADVAVVTNVLPVHVGNFADGEAGVLDRRSGWNWHATRIS